MSTNRTTALILEDELLIAIDLERTMLDAGFDVAIASSCAEAGTWLATARPDIAIVDLELSDGPSTPIVERLIAANVPFIVHSGVMASAVEGTPFARGQWIGKPANSDDILAAAYSLLRG